LISSNIFYCYRPTGILEHIPESVPETVSNKLIMTRVYMVGVSSEYLLEGWSRTGDISPVLAT
jgi:hypothetical protein